MEKERLTNEQLRQKCQSQFELVNYAIRLAEYFIKTGKEPIGYTTQKNTALQVIVEIDTNNELQPIPEIPQEEKEAEVPSRFGMNGKEPREPSSGHGRTSEKKKSKSRIET